MRHVWFDPGKTTGWAFYIDDKPERMGEFDYPSTIFIRLPLILQEHQPELVGIENYRLRPKGMKQGYTPVGDEAWAIRVIGIIEMAAQGIAEWIVYQEPDIKPAGYGYANLGKYNPNKKGMHMQDALAHGAFYWMENRVKANRKRQP